MKLADFVITPSKTSKIPTHVFFFAGGDLKTESIFKTLEPRLARLNIKPEDKIVRGFDNVSGYDRVYIVGLGKKETIKMRRIKNAVANVAKKLKKRKIEEVAIHIPTFLTDDPFETGKAVSVGMHLGNYQFLKYKSKKIREESPAVAKCTVIAPVYDPEQLAQCERGIVKGAIISGAVYEARDLVNDPANNARPLDMSAKAKEIAAASHGLITVKILDRKQCKTLGMGAYLGVAQGSDEESQFIVMHYTPRKKAACSIALVGKSITFDSGGLSLKPPASMVDMKLDMAGGATVLGVFSALVNLETPAEVWGVLPACENMPSGKAQKPGDIVTAMNGKTIEVLNTDAEGRLTLADGLVYTERKIKPDYIIDLATLTGASIVALGTDLAALFGRDDIFTKKFFETAKIEGDDCWTLPLYRPYKKHMVSDIADLKNIGGGRNGGAITAALFLSEFVENKKWIHVDMAGPAHRDDSGAGMNGKGASGWGVQTLLTLFENLN